MLNRQQIISSLFKKYASKLAIGVSAIALSIFVWLNPFTATVNTTANAEPVVAISGVSEQVEGEVQKDVGAIKRNVGEVTGQAEGALDQAKGEAKQSLGTAKNKLDEAKDNVENKSESFIDTVKDFFN